MSDLSGPLCHFWLDGSGIYSTSVASRSPVAGVWCALEPEEKAPT